MGGVWSSKTATSMWTPPTRMETSSLGGRNHFWRRFGPESYWIYLCRRETGRRFSQERRQQTRPIQLPFDAATAILRLCICRWRHRGCPRGFLLRRERHVSREGYRRNRSKQRSGVLAKEDTFDRLRLVRQARRNARYDHLVAKGYRCRYGNVALAGKLYGSHAEE